jgi:hypothetical protein
MPGLVPGIHALLLSRNKDVDGRVKPGHDEHITTSRIIELDEIAAILHGSIRRN